MKIKSIPSPVVTGAPKPITVKQLDTLKLVIEQSKSGSAPDIDQMTALAPWKPAKTSMQHMLTYLEEHGLITRGFEFRRGAVRRLAIVTEAGHAQFGKASPHAADDSSFGEAPSDRELLAFDSE